jgi:hypothetical protein
MLPLLYEKRSEKLFPFVNIYKSSLNNIDKTDFCYLIRDFHVSRTNEHLLQSLITNYALVYVA